MVQAMKTMTSWERDGSPQNEADDVVLADVCSQVKLGAILRSDAGI